MNKSKFRRSLVKFNQNTNEISQHLAFLPLLTLSKQELRVQPQGLAVIEEQSAGRIFLIAIYSRNSALINALYRNNNLLQDEYPESGAWITNYPRYDYQNNRQYLFIHVVCRSPEDSAILHSFCSLICSAVVVDLTDAVSLDYLNALSGRVIFSAFEKNENTNKNERKKELANVVLVSKSKNRESPADLRRNSRELEEMLTRYSVPQSIRQLYRQLAFLLLSSDALEGGQSHLVRLEEQLRELACSSGKNEDLRNGPILREYTELVGQALARSGAVDITATINSIRISEGYHAYLRAVQFYTATLKRDLREEGVPNIREVLREAREDALEEFKKESNDATYLLRITQHIDEKEEKLIDQNNKVLDLRNLAFLRQASETLLGRISAGKVPPQQVQAEIDAIVTEYKSQASGDNKYQILTNYLNILHSAVNKNITNNETSTLKKELESTRRERDDLEERLDRLRRENSNKCCEIM